MMFHMGEVSSTIKFKPIYELARKTISYYKQCQFAPDEFLNYLRPEVGRRRKISSLKTLEVTE